MNDSITPTPHDHDPDELAAFGPAAPKPFSRRAALGAIAGLGAAAVLAACGSNGSNSGAATTSSNAATSSPATSSANSTAGSTASSAGTTASSPIATSATTATSATAGTATLTEIPEETAGPYPGDGSNGKNVLDVDGVVRSDVRSSFGSANGVAAGVPLTVQFRLTDTSGNPLAGKAIYMWHCDRDGNYSMYSAAAADENYLRGVQPSDASGTVAFTTIFPGAYSGRWPHIHFEVYDSVADATSGGSLLATSQIALPQDICEQVYATDGYSQSIRNLAQTSLTTDMVFGDDGGVHELATMTGTTDNGLTATLAVAV